jgi:hypothetical protein
MMTLAFAVHAVSVLLAMAYFLILNRAVPLDKDAER